MKTEDLQGTISFRTCHWITVAMFGLSLLCGIGYGTINIMLTGRVSNTLIWFLPLSALIALLAWGYARKAVSWAPFVLVGYILMMIFILPAKVQRMTWTGLVTECRYETIYLMGYDMQHAEFFKSTKNDEEIIDNNEEEA